MDVHPILWTPALKDSLFGAVSGTEITCFTPGSGLSWTLRCTSTKEIWKIPLVHLDPVCDTGAREFVTLLICLLVVGDPATKRPAALVYPHLKGVVRIWIGRPGQNTTDFHGEVLELLLSDPAAPDKPIGE